MNVHLQGAGPCLHSNEAGNELVRPQLSSTLSSSVREKPLACGAGDRVESSARGKGLPGAQRLGGGALRQQEAAAAGSRAVMVPVIPLPCLQNKLFLKKLGDKVPHLLPGRVGPAPISRGREPSRAPQGRAASLTPASSCP